MKDSLKKCSVCNGEYFHKFDPSNVYQDIRCAQCSGKTVKPDIPKFILSEKVPEFIINSSVVEDKSGYGGNCAMVFTNFGKIYNYNFRLKKIVGEHDVDSALKEWKKENDKTSV